MGGNMGIVHFLWVQESLLKVKRVPVCPRGLEFWVGITEKERALLHVHTGSTVHPLITEMAARIFCTTLTMADHGYCNTKGESPSK